MFEVILSVKNDGAWNRQTVDRFSPRHIVDTNIPLRILLCKLNSVDQIILLGEYESSVTLAMSVAKCTEVTVNGVYQTYFVRLPEKLGDIDNVSC